MLGASPLARRDRSRRRVADRGRAHPARDQRRSLSQGHQDERLRHRSGCTGARRWPGPPRRGEGACICDPVHHHWSEHHPEAAFREAAWLILPFGPPADSPLGHALPPRPCDRELASPLTARHPGRAMTAPVIRGLRNLTNRFCHREKAIPAERFGSSVRRPNTPASQSGAGSTEASRTASGLERSRSVLSGPGWLTDSALTCRARQPGTGGDTGRDRDRDLGLANGRSRCCGSMS